MPRKGGYKKSKSSHKAGVTAKASGKKMSVKKHGSMFGKGARSMR